jgi:hypothetical protein
MLVVQVIYLIWSGWGERKQWKERKERDVRERCIWGEGWKSRGEGCILPSALASHISPTPGLAKHSSPSVLHDPSWAECFSSSSCSAQPPSHTWARMVSLFSPGTASQLHSFISLPRLSLPICSLCSLNCSPFLQALTLYSSQPNTPETLALFPLLFFFNN